MDRKNYWTVLLALLLILATAGCAGAPAAGGAGQATVAVPGGSGEPAEGKLKVVTTIFPPYDFVREIAGDRVELAMLLSPGAESHSYDPTPQDIIMIQDCDVFLYVGGETDLWVERILESMDTDGMRRIAMMDLVEVVEEELVEGMQHGHSHEDGHDDEDAHDHEDEDAHGHDDEVELDEHVWTNPRNAALIVREIAQALAELDGDNAAAYSAGADAYCAQLEELDASFREMVDAAARRTVIFGDRFPFRYLADAYGLRYYAAFPGCSTETEASASTVAFLIDKVREESIPAVFHIELSNEKMADTICEGTGAAKLRLHSCHNVTKDEFEQGITYLELMRENLENLRAALG